MYKASIFNYLFNSVNAIVMIINGIIMVPIYFKFMTISTYGAWLATGNVVAMIGLIESGFGTVITQKMSVAIANKNDKQFFELACANIYSAIILAITIFILGLSISAFIADWINAEEVVKSSITEAFIISLASASISLIVSLLGAFPQVWQETKTTGLISIIVNILSIVFLLIFLYLGFGVVALALGYLIRAVLNFIGMCSWILIKWKKHNLSRPLFNLNVIKVLIKDCFYPFLSKITDVLMGNTQSFIIALFINPALAAVYDITGKIAVVACNFVNMANSSFFGLFSLTFAAKNHTNINNLVMRVFNFFMTTLFSALLYSVVFTKYIVHFWVGLDKYGGDILLLFIVASLFITQLKQYYNNLLFSGGLINKSAKLDVLSMILFIVLLIVIINYAQIYAIPIATFISGIIFVGLYLKLLKKDLCINIDSMFKLGLKLFLSCMMFFVVNYLLKFDLWNVRNLAVYGISFTVLYVLNIVLINKNMVKIILASYRK